VAPVIVVGLDALPINQPFFMRLFLTVGFLFTLVGEEMQSTFVVATWHGAGVGPLPVAGTADFSCLALLARRNDRKFCTGWV
jgi:hypothetical protein